MRITQQPIIRGGMAQVHGDCSTIAILYHLISGLSQQAPTGFPHLQSIPAV